MGAKRPARREFLKSGAALAGGFTLGAATPASGQAPPSPPMIKGDKDQIPYGDRSRFVKSVRIAHGGRPSPDGFGLYFHIATPLQDSVGVITPSSLHFVGTTRGSYIPEIDPKTHQLLIHGMVDRPLTFTMEDLKRLPSVTRLHFIECAGNRTSRRAQTVEGTLVAKASIVEVSLVELTSSPRSTACCPRRRRARKRGRVFLSERLRDEPNDAREANAARLSI